MKSGWVIINLWVWKNSKLKTREIKNGGWGWGSGCGASFSSGDGFSLMKYQQVNDGQIERPKEGVGLGHQLPSPTQRRKPVVLVSFNITPKADGTPPEANYPNKDGLFIVMAYAYL
ncbi:hypothetical protein V6N12_074917 [Hibiscus sabdariffa]|uniref:Uncharacterized protein n=1 Tax=Hibiscus sabdariffa TaxID=183260 RepID=A0ABR2D2S3_9ROSI